MEYLFTERAHLMCPNMCFGMMAEVHFDGQIMEVGSGFHTFEKSL